MLDLQDKQAVSQKATGRVQRCDVLRRLALVLLEFNPGMGPRVPWRTASAEHKCVVRCPEALMQYCENFDDKILQDFGYNVVDAEANPALARITDDDTLPKYEEGKHFRIVCWERGHERKKMPIFTAKHGAIELDMVGSPRASRIDSDTVPGGFMLKNVLTARECDQIIKMSEAFGYTKGRNLRQNQSSVWIADEALCNSVFQRCIDSLPAEVQGGKLCGLNGRWRLYKYSPSDSFDAHFDASWPGSELDISGKLRQDWNGDRWSQLTMILYLNDDFEGGPTRFLFSTDRADEYRTEEMKAERGGAVCFFHGEHPLSHLHEGGRVTAGTKYVIRTDVMYELPPGGKNSLDTLSGMLMKMVRMASPQQLRQVERVLQTSLQDQNDGDSRRSSGPRSPGRPRSPHRPSTTKPPVSCESYLANGTISPAFFAANGGRVLIVGDGDLSFAASLNRLHNLNENLVASVYDSRDVVLPKYSGMPQRIAELEKSGAKVLCSVDARKLTMNKEIVENEEIVGEFSRIIFQFPLLPAKTSKEEYLQSCKDPTVENRLMLLEFLLEAKQLITGDGLIVITSKDIKPYDMWRLGDKLACYTGGKKGEEGTGGEESKDKLAFLGKVPFSLTQFPGYKCQNVERDSRVKDTDAFSYLYGRESFWDVVAASAAKKTATPGDEKAKKSLGREPENAKSTSTPGSALAHLVLHQAGYLKAYEERTLSEKTSEISDRMVRCAVCNAGPFTNSQDKELHFESKTHKRMTKSEPLWDKVVAEMLEGRGLIGSSGHELAREMTSKGDATAKRRKIASSS